MSDKTTTERVAEIQKRHKHENEGHLYLERKILGQAHKDRAELLAIAKKAE